ncbi:MAG: STAS/SEC14 domain-containing protein [Akkermansiaceae bacterium]|nr:STAS/SEC14 domain-containing protein [Akkermansiaceae bacterium]
MIPLPIPRCQFIVGPCDDRGPISLNDGDAKPAEGIGAPWPSPRETDDRGNVPQRNLVLTELYGGKLAELHVSGKLRAEDYEQVVPRLERMLRLHGKIRMLLQLHRFQGWDAGALWKDIQFDLHHLSDIERLAVIGEEKWEAGMAEFSIPFTHAEVRYFPSDKAELARHWVDEGLTR